MAKVKVASAVSVSSRKKKPVLQKNIKKKKSDYGKTIIKSLRRIIQCLDTHSRHLLKEYDLTIPQAMCLYEVYEKGAITIATLAESIHISSSTLIGIIDRLEQKTLVKRVRDEVDRRAVFIHITPKGKKFVSDSPNLMHNRLHDDLNKLPKGQQVMIADSLNSILHLL